VSLTFSPQPMDFPTFFKNDTYRGRIPFTLSRGLSFFPFPFSFSRIFSTQTEEGQFYGTLIVYLPLVLVPSFLLYMYW
jgi:hypothetical protein